MFDFFLENEHLSIDAFNKFFSLYFCNDFILYNWLHNIG